MKTRLLLTATAMTALIGSANAAVITVDDTGSFSQPYSGLPADRKFTLDSTALGTFDASGSDKLVLVMSGEKIGSTYDEISYGGVALTRITFAEPSVRDVAIFYLDDPGSGNLVIDLKGGNGVGIAVMALSNTVDGFVAPPSSTLGTSTSITTTGSDSLVVAGAVNNDSNGVTQVSPLTLLYKGEAGSSGIGSGYQQVATSGTAVTPTFTGAEAVLAVEFLAVPEPGSLALLGLGSLLIASRRRRG